MHRFFGTVRAASVPAFDRHHDISVRDPNCSLASQFISTYGLGPLGIATRPLPHSIGRAGQSCIDANRRNRPRVLEIRMVGPSDKQCAASFAAPIRPDNARSAMRTRDTKKRWVGRLAAYALMALFRRRPTVAIKSSLIRRTTMAPLADKVQERRYFRLALQTTNCLFRF